MEYKRKTQDVYYIYTNYGYGWEVESTYTKEDYKQPYQEAKKDAKEYQLAGANIRIVKKRVRLEK